MFHPTFTYLSFLRSLLSNKFAQLLPELRTACSGLLTLRLERSTLLFAPSRLCERLRELGIGRES